MKDIQEITSDFNRAIAGSHERNRQVLDDHEFANVPGAQWKGSDLKQFKNKPKPENNKVAHAVNRIVGQFMRLEMNAKIITKSDDSSDEDAELLQGLWRNDFSSSDGIFAINSAADEAFTGGFGAYRLVSKYDDEENPDDDHQHVELESILSAASCVVFNAGALRHDKRDAKQGWILVRANREELELEYGKNFSGFNQAVTWFDWSMDGTKDVYVAHYYEVVEKKITIFDFGGGVTVTKDGTKYTDDQGLDVTKEELAQLLEFNDYERKTKKIKYCEYALISGNKILEKPRRTPFKAIPIIPQYGYHTVINGIEYYCGEVARQRDPQRFENMGFSSMMQIMASPATEKREYLPEQIERFKHMHSNMNIDDYAYLLSDPVYDENDKIIQMGPVGIQAPAQIGTGLASAMQYLQQANAEQAGTGQSTLPANVSAAAVQQVNDRQDDSYQKLFENAMHSMKACCEVYVDAAQLLYFTNERTVRTKAEDGSYSRVKTMQYDTDEETGNYGPYKNSARGKYDVVVTIGESHKSKKEAELATNKEMLQYTDTNSPKGQLILNNAIMATTGEGGADLRRIARFENLRIMADMGIDPQPKTDEEKQFIQNYMQQKQQQMQMQMQQQQQMQEQTIVAEGNARLMEGQAAIMNEKNDAVKNQIEMEKVKNDRAALMVKAQEAGVKIEGMQIDNQIKVFGAANKTKQQEPVPEQPGGLNI